MTCSPDPKRIDRSAAKKLSPSGALPDETLKKSDRILSRGLFRRIYEDGQKIRARYFIGFVRPNNDEGPRIGITVTKRVGNSVIRNRSRRLVREVFRKNKWRVPLGVDIVINVKSGLVEAGFDEIERDFLAFLERSK